MTCECGDCLRADSPDEMVAEMQRHLEVAHPEIAGAPRAEDLLAMVEFDD